MTAGLLQTVVLATLLAAAPLRAETLHHVHGLAFTSDGAALVVPSHVGLALYRAGGWTRSAGPSHDFMGFSVTRDAIYSSGHPAAGSPLRDPFGLIKSGDGGKTWQPLGLAGEADFHLMAAGWRSNAVYMLNERPSSAMQRTGLYFTRDDGRTWVRAEANGVASQILALAVHPVDPAVVAVGTLRNGLMLSRDHGKSFRPLGSADAVTAVLFEHDGKRLLYAAPAKASLERRTLDGQSSQLLKLPALGKDFVTFIAQNPANPRQLAIATRSRDVFLSNDAGASWRQIARQGNGT